MASPALLCYLCQRDRGSIDVASTGILALMEPMRQRAIKTGPNDLVCKDCADLFVQMDDLKKQYELVKNKAYKLMRDKVNRMKQGTAGTLLVPKTPRYNCKTCGYKTFDLDDFAGHECTSVDKTFFVDFLTDELDKDKEQQFQNLLDLPEDSPELKTGIVIDGQLRTIRAVIDEDNNQMHDEAEIADSLKDDSIQKYIFEFRPSDDDE